EFGPNEVAAVPRIPMRSRVAAQLRDPLIMVMLAALVLTVVAGDYPDVVTHHDVRAVG
ncbi:cation-transporting P-type ATPase, partial [Actinacidiphila bryophytorum]